MRRYSWTARFRVGAAAALTIFTASCGGDSGGTGPDDNQPTNGSMSARIDGAQWTANVGIQAVRASGAIGLAGSNGEFTVSLGFVGSGPGTFNVGDGSGANGTVITFDSQQIWQAVSAMGSGTITVTSLTDERVVGTFSFTAPAVATSDATGTKVVTEGAFNVKF